MSTREDALAFLQPGAALRGPLFASLLDRLAHAPRELLPGQRIGPYRVKAALGRGGSAVVYLAERADGEFEQEVALKLVAPGPEAEAARTLLRRERQILATLRHPGIARLLDGGTTEDGQLWFAMEPIAGECIDGWCAGRPLGERLRLFLEVCAAVEFAHAHLLVHRDLKPSNILVGTGGEAHLLDFGIAAMLERADAAASAPAAMTPGYASPEQRRGAAPTTASDIWQLGRLLETMLADEPTWLRRERDLEAIIAKARHEQPAGRYATVRELGDDVRRLRERRPVLARNGGPGYRAARFLARHRWSMAAAGAGLAALLAMAATFAWRLAGERDLAQREARHAQAATEFLVGLFQVNDPAINRGESLTARELLARANERLRAELADQPALRARLLHAIGRIHLVLGEAAHADPLLAEAIELGRGRADVDAAAQAAVLQARADAALQLGRPRDALVLLAQAEPVLGSSNDPRLRVRRLSLLGLRAMAQLGSGQPHDAHATQQAALALAIESTGPDSLETASAVHDLGIVQRALDRKPDALRSFERAHAIYLAHHGGDHPHTVKAQKSVATALIQLGDVARGGSLLEDAVERQRRLYGGRGATYGAALRVLAELKRARHDTVGARASLLESARLIEAASGPDAANLGYTLHALAEVHAALGEHQLALDAARRALAIRTRLRPAGHPELVATQALATAQRRALEREPATGAPPAPASPTPH
jgi:serine/threonine-protein kinase